MPREKDLDVIWIVSTALSTHGRAAAGYEIAARIGALEAEPVKVDYAGPRSERQSRSSARVDACLPIKRPS